MVLLRISFAFASYLSEQGVEAKFVSFVDEGEGWSHVAVVIGEGDDKQVVDWTYNQFASAMWGADEVAETHPLVMGHDEYLSRVYDGPVAQLTSFEEDLQFVEGSLEDISTFGY